MIVANLTLSKRLYELAPGWGDKQSMDITEHAWYDVRSSDHQSGEWEETAQRYEVLCVDREARYYNNESTVGFERKAWTSEYISPAYDLDWLLLKLPRYIPTYKSGTKHPADDYQLHVVAAFNGDWIAQYSGLSELPLYIECSSTPANAACKLLIFLIKEGIITP